MQDGSILRDSLKKTRNLWEFSHKRGWGGFPNILLLFQVGCWLVKVVLLILFRIGIEEIPHTILKSSMHSHCSLVTAFDFNVILGQISMRIHLIPDLQTSNNMVKVAGKKMRKLKMRQWRNQSNQYGNVIWGLSQHFSSYRTLVKLDKCDEI